MVTFGKRLKQLRNKNNVTLQELAEALGTTNATLSRYENDIRKPSIDFINRAADYFEVDTDYLLGRTDIPRRDPEWFDKLPPEIQEMVIEREVDYLEVGFIAKEKGWTKEAILEMEELLNKLYRNFDKNP